MVSELESHRSNCNMTVIFITDVTCCFNQLSWCSRCMTREERMYSSVNMAVNGCGEMTSTPTSE